MHVWSRTIEELKLASLDQGTRVLGILSPIPEAGVSQLCRMMAETSHWAGARTLLADLSQGPDMSIPQLAWQANMTVYEDFGTPNALSVRALRQALQSALGQLRLTRDIVSGIAVTASDMTSYIVEQAKPNRVGLRVALDGKAVKLEILHDGPAMAEDRLPLLKALPDGSVPPDDDTLHFTLARRSLPRWDYETGPLHRLIGWCNLDGTECGLPPAPTDWPEGLDRITANPTGALRATFNNVDQMRKLFQEELAAYRAVIVDLPAILGDHKNRINPLATAAACDGVYVLCMAGVVDRDTLGTSVKLLRQSSVNVLGVVVNDAVNPSLGFEMAREARRLQRIAPSISRWLERKALAARFLN